MVGNNFNDSMSALLVSILKPPNTPKPTNRDTLPYRLMTASLPLELQHNYLLRWLLAKAVR